MLSKDTLILLLYVKGSGKQLRPKYIMSWNEHNTVHCPGRMRSRIFEQVWPHPAELQEQMPQSSGQLMTRWCYTGFFHVTHVWRHWIDNKSWSFGFGTCTVAQIIFKSTRRNVLRLQATAEYGLQSQKPKATVSQHFSLQLWNKVTGKSEASLACPVH